jgi:hypothetical protein
MTTRNVIDAIAIALLAAFTLIMSAQAQRGNLPVNDIIILPPDEFDRDYTGEMTIKRGDELDMKIACKGISMTGCTYRWNDERCVVYIANDDVLNKHYLSYDAVFRHERAHCLGWHHADESKKRY